MKLIFLLLTISMSCIAHAGYGSDQVKCTISKITYNPTEITEIAAGLVGGNDKIVIGPKQTAQILPQALKNEESVIAIYLANQSSSGKVTITTSSRMTVLALKEVSLIDNTNDIIVTCSQ